MQFGRHPGRFDNKKHQLVDGCVRRRADENRSIVANLSAQRRMKHEPQQTRDGAGFAGAGRTLHERHAGSIATENRRRRRQYRFSLRLVEGSADFLDSAFPECAAESRRRRRDGFLYRFRVEMNDALS